MTEHPTPAEAARALREVGQRKDQTFGSVRDPLWVRVVFGVAIFLVLAAPDFAGPGAIEWTSWGFAAIAVGYAVMLNTRRGSAVLGRPARLRRDAFSPRFMLIRRLILMGILAVGVVMAFIPHTYLNVPYLRTIAGAVLGLALIIFGPAYQRWLITLARRSPDRGKTVDGLH